jgi:hypothetical protein
VEGEKLSDSTKQKEKAAEKKLSAMDVDHTKTKLELKKVQVGVGPRVKWLP